MIHIKSIQKNAYFEEQKGFPFDVPVIANLKPLKFKSSVTFFVGENGSGKSTLLEALAAKTTLDTIGSVKIDTDESLAHARKLASCLTVVWAIRRSQGFFLRAEDYFGYVKWLQERNRDREGFENSYFEMYGGDLDSRSHGESFVAFLQARLRQNSVYLIDEPEAALSPMRQIALIALIKNMVASDCQFVIATHSPILLATPGACIYQFEGGEIRETPYDELEHVTLTRSFLANPDAFVRRL